jgi:hypothetical protein
MAATGMREGEGPLICFVIETAFAQVAQLLKRLASQKAPIEAARSVTSSPITVVVDDVPSAT